MSTILCFVIINHSSDDSVGSNLLDSVLITIRDALTEQLNTSYSDFYGGNYHVRVGTIQDRSSGEVAINIRDSIPEAPGALGYHYVTDGVPDIEIGLDTIDGYVTGSQSLSAVASHEVLETGGDRGANEWVDRGDGTMRAKELCDTVEDTTYAATNGASLSNFLLPNAFIPGAPGPWDFLQLLASANSMTAGGYDIEASAPTSIHEVTALKSIGMGVSLHHGRLVRARGVAIEFGSKRHARKTHPYSRAHRRGVRL